MGDKASFNPAAAAFVPSFNAAAFVPGAAASAAPAVTTPPQPEPAEPEPVPAPAAAEPEPEPVKEPEPEPEPEAEPEDKWAGEDEPEPEEKPTAAAAPAAAASSAATKKPAASSSTSSSSASEGVASASASASAVAARQDHREHLNIVFIGHVDAGKSTIGGHLMFLTGGVDKRTLEKYEREAREKNRESWYLSWAMDTNEEERAKGKTVECGQAHFTTDQKHFTIIDAPGHKSFVPNMISGAAQADVAVLVISARKGEFEAGFDRHGQTREHAMLAKTAGVRTLIVAINKMDDPTVEWAKERYDECKTRLSPYLRQVGFGPKDVTFMPVSGLKGLNLTDRLDKSMCDWYDGPALVEFLDAMPKVVRMLDAPVMMPITDKYSDMGTMVVGKLQSGAVSVGSKLVIMPNKKTVVIDKLYQNDEEIDHAQSGDNIKIRLKNCGEEDAMPGYVLCAPESPCNVARVFDAQVVVLEYKSIIGPGFTAVLHLHSAVEDVTIRGLICHISKKTGKPDKKKGRPRFMKQGDVMCCRLEVEEHVCIETFKNHAHMGRFTLRDEGKSIAIGKVLGLIDARG